jgi:hypothetical protein
MMMTKKKRFDRQSQCGQMEEDIIYIIVSFMMVVGGCIDDWL